MTKIKEFIVHLKSGATNVTGPALDKVGLWTFVTALATLLLWWVAKKQLGAIRKVAQTDFARRFNKDFFNEKTRDLIMLFNYRALKFRMGEIKYETDDPDNGAQFPYFLIDEGVLRQLKIDQEKKEQIEKKMCFSAFEIDDDLLGYFEEIGSYEKQGLLDVQDVYNYFSWYMNVIWNSEEIQKYIESQKAEEAEDIYEDFKYIYEKCTSYRKAKLSGRCMWIWKIKWRLCKKLRLI